MTSIPATRLLALASLLLAALALLACGGGAEEPCPEGSDRYAEYQLFLGRSTGDGGEVSEEEWAAFLAEAVTPRFPDGLTVLDAAGQWRDSADAIQRERSKLLWILAPPGDEARRRSTRSPRSTSGASSRSRCCASSAAPAPRSRSRLRRA